MTINEQKFILYSKIIGLSDQNFTLTEILSELNMPRTTVNNIIKNIINLIRYYDCVVLEDENFLIRKMLGLF